MALFRGAAISRSDPRLIRRRHQAQGIDMDVVIPLSLESQWSDNELRYALRALAKNFCDLGSVFICTQRLPAWITGVQHVSTADRHPNRDANTIEAILAACNAGASDRFVRCSDDELLLVPTAAEELLPYHAGNILEQPPATWRTRWGRRLGNTATWLQENGFPTLHYDTHTPKVYDRDRFRQLMAVAPYGGHRGLTIESAYFNRLGADGPRLADQAAWFYGDDSAEAIKLQLAGKRYMNYGEATPAIRRALAELFPQPSRFELSSPVVERDAKRVEDNRDICRRCQERPAGCWKAVEYGCHQKYWRAARQAAETASCPLSLLR